MGRHFDGAQPEVLGQRDQVEIGRRLDGDRVARAGDGAQGQLQRFHATVGEQDVVGQELHPEVGSLAGDRFAQPQRSRRKRIVGKQARFVARMLRDQAGQGFRRVEIAAFRTRQGEVDDLGVRLRGNHAGNAVENGAFGVPGGWRRLRRGQDGRGGKAGAHKVAGLRPSLDPAMGLELPVGGEDGVDAQAATRRTFAYRRQTRAGGQASVVDGVAQIFRQRLVQRFARRGFGGGHSTSSM